MIHTEAWYREAFEKDLRNLQRLFQEGAISLGAYFTKFSRSHPPRDFPKDLLVPALRETSGVGLNLDGVDLEEADLSSIKFDGASLRGVRLVRSDLRDASFHGADLEEANLHWSYMWKTDFGGANLKGARLVGTTLMSNNFMGANLEGADLTGAIYYEDSFEGSKGTPLYPNPLNPIGGSQKAFSDRYKA